ncbi:MAG: hypothetical protein P1V51_01645 [Deltaproteobacteria bacterium]|nr:hypothetical protein [Deltaproteobacteria bacterium]
MRAERIFLSGALVLALAACPQPESRVGDVSLGEYDVRATQEIADCEIGDVVQDGDFDFRVRLSGDSGTDRVYMIVSVPPSYVEQAVVTGQVESGALVFSGQNATSLPLCGCSPMVEERFVFEPLRAADGGDPTDGGTPADGGVDDGGVDDGGIDDGGASPDGGAGEDVLGLPPLSEIVGLGGSLNYAVDTAPACQARDADAGTGCTLPCTIRYLLAGNLR